MRYSMRRQTSTCAQDQPVSSLTGRRNQSNQTKFTPFPPFHISGAPTMSGSFMPFCIIVFIFATLVLASKSKERPDPLTTSFLEGMRSIALSGALAVPFVSVFDGSLIKGIAASVLVGATFHFLTRLAFRSNVITLSSDDEGVSRSLSPKDANLPEHHKQNKE